MSVSFADTWAGGASLHWLSRSSSALQGFRFLPPVPHLIEEVYHTFTFLSMLFHEFMHEY